VKKLFKTLKNIWSIEELRAKILFTLLLLFIYRVGTHIVLPGIDPTKLDLGSSKTGILSLIDTFAGGAFSQASIFALGIMPYISASIFMQLMTVLVPRFQKMQKEGESGRKKINQWTRYLTVAVTAVQASAYVAYLRQMTAQNGGIIPGYSDYFWLSTVIVLTAGTMFVMWMGEKITDKGLGNGTSLIIMVGILARLPQSFTQELVDKSNRSGQILIFIIEIAILIAIIMGCILLVQGVRKIPVNYAKQIVGNRQFGGARQFLPSR
jgi:preprotein translocase subunit SecY